MSNYVYRLQLPQAKADAPQSEAGAVILKIAYGYTIEPHKRDPLVHMANVALDEFSKAGIPGAWLVDIIPARVSISFCPKNEVVLTKSSKVHSLLASRSRLQANCAIMEKRPRNCREQTICIRTSANGRRSASAILSLKYI